MPCPRDESAGVRLYHGRMTQTQAYLYLAFAIGAEVIGTTALKASDSFTRPWPSLVTVGCYALSFYLLTFSLRPMAAPYCRPASPMRSGPASASC